MQSDLPQWTAPHRASTGVRVKHAAQYCSARGMLWAGDADRDVTPLPWLIAGFRGALCLRHFRAAGCRFSVFVF